jgi:tetratricopeptide (TPR) repeat protein
MGLITKAVEKVEKQENSSFQPEIPPQPKSKKKIIILLVLLLFVGIASGAGYLFLLKPTQTAPSDTPRRSISTRQKSAKPKPPVSQQNQDTLTTKALEGKEIPPEKTLAQQKPEPPATVSEPKGKTPEPEIEPSNENVLSPGPKIKEEKKTPTSEIKPPLEPQLSSLSEKKSAPGNKVSSSEAKKDVISEDVLNETSSSEDEKTPTEKVTSTLTTEAERKTLKTPVSDQTMSKKDEKTPSEQSLLTSIPEAKKTSVPKPSGIIDKSNSRAERFYNKGVSYQQQGDFDNAIDSYKRALSFDPDHKQTHMNLATAYMQVGRYKEAERELIYLSALRPKDPKILFNFALLLYQTGELNSAESKLKRLLDSDPFHLEANLLLASIYEERGDIGQALELYTKAYRTNSTDSRVLYKLGRAFDMNKDKENAIKYYHLFLQAPAERAVRQAHHPEEELKSSVRDRLNYLLSQKEEK